MKRRCGAIFEDTPTRVSRLGTGSTSSQPPSHVQSGTTHLFILLSACDFTLPPHMTRKQYRRSLMTLLEQFTPMERRLGNQRIVIIRPKDSARLKRTDYPCDRLQLRSRFRYRFLVNHECLNKELVCQFFQSTIIRNLSSEEEQS